MIRPETIEPGCPVCGDTDGENLYARRQYKTGDLSDFGIVRCNTCRHAYLSPRPTDATLGSYYGEGYYTVANASSKVKRITEHALRYSGYVERLVGNKPGKLLDIGCGDGEFIGLMASKGWTCYGVELDERTRNLVRQKPGILAVEKAVHDIHETNFDCITMFEVVEHLTDPISELQVCRGLLKPDGKLLLKTPNFRSMERMALGPNWISLEIPRHIQFFDEHSTRSCLEKAGFKPTKFFQPWNEEALTRSLWLMLTNKGKEAAGAGAAFTPSSWRRRANKLISVLMTPLWYAFGLFGIGHTIMVVAGIDD